MRMLSKGQSGPLLGCVVVMTLPFACRDFRGDTSSSAAGSITVGGAGEAGGLPRGGDGPGADANGGAAGASSGTAGKSDDDEELPHGGGGAAGRDGGVDAAHGGAGAGGDAAGAGGEGGLAPSDFDELALWLEASPNNCQVDEGKRVTYWSDASSHGNDALPRAPFERPAYVNAVVNGHSVLRFAPVITGDGHDPTSLIVADSLSLQFGSHDFTYLTVMAWSNDPQPQAPGYTGAGSIFGKQAPMTPYAGLLLIANYPAPFPSAKGYTRFALQCAVGEGFALSRVDNLNDDRFRVYAVRRKGTDIAIRINGVPDNGTTVSSGLDLSAAGSPLVIGGSRGLPLKGDIAELIALHGTTSDADLARLEAYLMDKYALR